jgi:hypothetical protein
VDKVVELVEDTAIKSQIPMVVLELADQALWY